MYKSAKENAKMLVTRRKGFEQEQKRVKTKNVVGCGTRVAYK